MAKEKREVTTMTFNKADIDPGIRAAFNQACAQRGLNRGTAINDLMQQFVIETYGAGANRAIEQWNQIISSKLETK